jgi:hypothetical protein
MRGSELPVIPAEAKLDDRIFFRRHADRRLRIREPKGDEYLREFRGFGMHDESRRRVIVSRLAAGQMRRFNIDFLRIPFLLFGDEMVEDRDDVLAPILKEIMMDAASGYGMSRR